jgi:hypothetical protein
MKRLLYVIPVSFLTLSTAGMGENSFLHLEYQNFHFNRSMQKDKGQRYITHIGYGDANNFYEAAYSKTHTKTFQPPMSADLNVDKYYLKYTRNINTQQSIALSYATISDNLTKETDGGHIYGFAYRYQTLKLYQYISDYKHFNTYQTDITYTIKHRFKDIQLSSTLMGKYIHLQNRKSNPYTAKADADYFSPGIMAKARYGAYHAGAGAFFGKRIFAVMNNGFSVQNRAMEFDRTYMLSVGKKLGAFDITFKYLYMRATEVPIENKDVTLNNLIASIKYHF